MNNYACPGLHRTPLTRRAALRVGGMGLFGAKLRFAWRGVCGWARDALPSVWTLNLKRLLFAKLEFRETVRDETGVSSRGAGGALSLRVSLVLAAIMGTLALAAHAESADPFWKYSEPHGKGPIDRFTSPDQHYTVRLLKPADRDGGHRTFHVLRDGRKSINVKMDGFLLNVFFGPNGLIAVNDRNAIFGDYLWVFDALHGKVIRNPDQELPMNSASLKSSAQIFAGHDIFRQWVLASGWTLSGELKVREISYYERVPRFLSINLVYAVIHDRLVLKSQRVSLLARD
jgi:hypothetical protein